MLVQAAILLATRSSLLGRALKLRLTGLTSPHSLARLDLEKG